MLSLYNSATMGGAAELDIDPRLRGLIALRVAQISQSDDCDVGELVHFLIVLPGDAIDDIDSELGFSLLVNIVDETRYGDPDFMPSWEWIERHDGCFELAYVLSDDGFGWIELVQDVAGVDPELLAMCNNWAG